MAKNVELWTEADVEKWLDLEENRDLFAPYRESIKKFKIDGSVLIVLSKLNLEEIGVVESTTKVKIMRKIAALRGTPHEHCCAACLRSSGSECDFQGEL